MYSTSITDFPTLPRVPSATPKEGAWIFNYDFKVSLERGKKTFLDVRKSLDVPLTLRLLAAVHAGAIEANVSEETGINCLLFVVYWKGSPLCDAVVVSYSSYIHITSQTSHYKNICKITAMCLLVWLLNMEAQYWQLWKERPALSSRVTEHFVLNKVNKVFPRSNNN